MNTKVCFQSDGTKETGAKIIRALKNLGGLNKQEYQGSNPGNHYYITEENKIDHRVSIPDGYTLANPDDYLKEEKPYPKWMWVTDISEEQAVRLKQRYEVVGEFVNSVTGIKCYVAWNGDNEAIDSWRFAVDISEDAEQELIKKEIEELRAKLDELEGRVK